MKAYTAGLKELRVIAHPVRTQILWMLRERRQYGCHLVMALGRRQAYVSQHLACLRRAGLAVPVSRV
ncbi:MAG TPA: ArsR family transcriptional regulator [Anaerolineae bacterium]|nr:ArsR family transcriptional regulator [Anaerolineae bacterium]